MDKIKRRRLRKISCGLQVGVTSIHLLLAVILFIASVVILIMILPDYIEILNSGEEEEVVDDEEKTGIDKLTERLDALGRAITILIFFLSIIGIVMGLVLVSILSFILVGNIKNLRSKKRVVPKKRNYFLIPLDSLIIFGLAFFNIWIFNDMKTRSVVGLIILFWILMMAITISHMIIFITTAKRSY